MLGSHRLIANWRADLPFVLLCAFFATLWFAGGASRMDVIGQAVVRLCAWLVLFVYILAGPSVNWRRIRVPAIMLGSMIGAVLLHLVPLPPSIWQELPGREILEPAAALMNQPQPWRPLTFSPSFTENALWSLIVPAVVLVLMTGLTKLQVWRLRSIILLLIMAGMLVGLLQFSGGGIDNPMVNDIAGTVVGTFANRNHFALFVAFGCVIGPSWALHRHRRQLWRILAVIGLIPCLALTSLATGSRTGLLVWIVGLAIGLLIVRRPLIQEFGKFRKSTALWLIAGLAVALVGLLSLAVTMDRAISIERALSMNAAEDLRILALPTVLGMVEGYFPIGSGFGAFDPVYRISEPDELLLTMYFNHAHNDWIEIVLDGGLIGVALLLVGVGWWFAASLRVWRFRAEVDSADGRSDSIVLARIGSGILLLVFIASITDYPARTPLIMGVIAVAATWLFNSAPRSAALLAEERDL